MPPTPGSTSSLAQHGVPGTVYAESHLQQSYSSSSSHWGSVLVTDIAAESTFRAEEILTGHHVHSTLDGRHPHSLWALGLGPGAEL